MSTADWIALGLFFLTALGLGGSTLCFLMKIAERLGTMAKSLERIEKDLTNNQAEHHELFAAVGEHREQLGKHDVRITTLEEANRRDVIRPIGG